MAVQSLIRSSIDLVIDHVLIPQAQLITARCIVEDHL